MCCARPEGGKGHGPQAYRDCLTDGYSLSDNTVRLRKTCVLRRRALCTVCAPAAGSVTGAGLLHLSVDSLQRTLSFNAFAAEKVCRLRGVFLSAGATRRR